MRYRIIFDPNDDARDAHGKLYRQYTIQRRRWWGWQYLTHDFVGSGMAINWDPKEKHISHYGSREQCLERIRQEEMVKERQPVQIENVKI